jgi:Mg2+/Co2+ transporter CorC
MLHALESRYILFLSLEKHAREKEAFSMETKQVRDVMIPIKNYVTVHEEDSLYDVIQVLETSKAANKGRAHRDAIVMDEKGKLIGKVTMFDIFRALETNYNKIDVNKIIAGGHGRLTEEMIKTATEGFDFWVAPAETICERGKSMEVSEIMHIPTGNEYIMENESLEKALHQYVLGAHQPLIVKKDDTVTGMLRFGDIFEVIRENLLTC